MVCRFSELDGYGKGSSGVICRALELAGGRLSELTGITHYYVGWHCLRYGATETATNSYVWYYHNDCRGSTVALTDHESRVTDRYEYSAYGTLTYSFGNTDTPFLFNGRFGVQTDPNGLLYMRARYYNPYICRFINPDPVGFAGGLNWYAYAYGNPVCWPDGQMYPSDPFAPGGAFYVPFPWKPDIMTSFLSGAAVGAVIAGAVTVAAPAAVSGLVAAGVPTATASAAVTGTLGIAGAVGGSVTVYNAGQNAFAGNWNNVAYDVGLLGGGALVGGLGGGRYIADNVSPSPSTVPRSWNPFTADRGYEFVRNPELPWLQDRWNWLGTGPTPSSGGEAAMGIGSGVGLLFQPPATSGSWVSPWAGQ